jgi:hypothetical protein
MKRIKERIMGYLWYSSGPSGFLLFLWVENME